jgi:hypothetical protein
MARGPTSALVYHLARRLLVYGSSKAFEACLVMGWKLDMLKKAFENESNGQCWPPQQGHAATE